MLKKVKNEPNIYYGSFFWRAVTSVISNIASGAINLIIDRIKCAIEEGKEDF